MDESIVKGGGVPGRSPWWRNEGTLCNCCTIWEQNGKKSHYIVSRWCDMRSYDIINKNRYNVIMIGTKWNHALDHCVSTVVCKSSVWMSQLIIDMRFMSTSSPHVIANPRLQVDCELTHCSHWYTFDCMKCHHQFSTNTLAACAS